MAGNNALLAIVAVFILIIAGCSQQAAPTPEPQPQPTQQCPGTGANYCNGNELMMNAKCVLGMWQYSSEVCANGCEAGKCKEAEELCGGITTNYAMPYSEAEQIASASSACSELGSLKGKGHSCNANSGTWWVEPGITKDGCTPACVVFVDNKSAEINWRCTGLLPENTTAPQSILDCDDKNICTQDGFEDSRCLNVPVVDGTACGTGMECKAGACIVSPPAPPVEPKPPAVVEPEAVPPTTAELSKLLACGASFADKNYRVTISDSYTSTAYDMKLTNSIRTDYIQTDIEYKDMPFPEYNSVLVSDYRSVGSCACNQRQLLINYKAYGGRSSGQSAMGGTCGVAPDPIKQAVLLYDNVDSAKMLNIGTETVNFVGYNGPATHFYQETTLADKSVVKASYYIAGSIPATIRLNGTVDYVDGTSKNFVVALLP
ncbi:MAG: hypothetical protein WC759_01195 [Candidatus Micrarchaeia archaeon]|jgi:hypothetical protein